MIRQIQQKLQGSIIENGYAATARKAAQAIPRRLASRRVRRNFKLHYGSLPTPEERFTKIYQQNYWTGGSSGSGSGSSIEYTANLRTRLPEVFRQFSISRVLDAPCGDFNWMKEVVSATQITYTGGDIVQPLVEELQVSYGSENVRFLHLDITQDPLPHADLMICRDCLFHLSYEDARRVLENFLSSGIPYLLTTTHTRTSAFKNHDITTGDYRLIDLHSEPYNFPCDFLVSIDDWIPPFPERAMRLWTREQVSLSLQGQSG